MQVLDPFQQLIEYVASNALVKPLRELDEAVKLAELRKLHYVVTKLCLSLYYRVLSLSFGASGNSKVRTLSFNYFMQIFTILVGGDLAAARSRS